MNFYCCSTLRIIFRSFSIFISRPHFLHQFIICSVFLYYFFVAKIVIFSFVLSFITSLLYLTSTCLLEFSFNFNVNSIHTYLETKEIIYTFITMEDVYGRCSNPDCPPTTRNKFLQFDSPYSTTKHVYFLLTTNCCLARNLIYIQH